MGVHIPDTASEDRAAIDEMQNFFIGRNVRTRQSPKIFQNNSPLAELAQREFADDERMNQNLTAFKKIREPVLVPAEMIHPDRRIDKDHAGSGRRRGAGVKSGSVPPSRANRRALSRSISAVKASRSKADLSFTPV